MRLWLLFYSANVRTDPVSVEVACTSASDKVLYFLFQKFINMTVSVSVLMIIASSSQERVSAALI